MRRTYRSKKETAGALDHKEVLQTLDEKSSAFDAFYIQNIKQTKRELSCIGSSSQYGGPTNKVRKRKYVKRIVKDPENSPTHSVFLTPDKSIRVNKGHDLFDQLLNSSSPQQTGFSKNSLDYVGKFPNKQPGKVYTRKKLAKVKKFNCSSSDSMESDKENSNEDCKTHNVTDLRSFELVIETEKKPSPKYLDESINNIVKNMSALGNFNRDTSTGLTNKSFSNMKHRLTTNVHSPSNSPLCSTPFKEKYRSQSIYRFSPISFGKNDVSEDCITILEENDNSIVPMEKQNESEKSIVCEDNPPSPVIHLKSLKCEVSKTSSTNSETHVNTPHTKEEIEILRNESNSKQFKISSIEISDLQTTESEPFLGFANNELKDESQSSKVEEDESLKTDIQSSKHDSSGDIFEDSKSIIENLSENENDISNHSVNKTEEDPNEDESSYGTCNSEQSLQCAEEAIRVPVIKLERLNNSVLEKYLNKIVLSDTEDNTDCDVSNSFSDDYASFELSQTSKLDTDNSLSEEFDDGIQKDYSYMSDTENHSIINDINGNSNSEEERCISFVTTRRRNEIANDSLIFGFNNSFESASSTDCNKTVLSNNKEDNSNMLDNVSSQIVNTNEEILVQVADEDKEDTVSELNAANVSNVTKISRVSTRRSLKLQKDRDIRRSFIEEGKTGIVLQPGKKWERSLSIYRRMTMMTDHFDQSILDDDEFHNKGRKYRQSVISTMELQDKSSLNNESNNSRRSTFVSKPCRSTIRIIKEPNSSRLSLSTTIVSDDLRGFVNEDCDDTIIELSKLSIADSEHEVTVIENFHDTSNRVSTARDYVLRRCAQTDAILFDECYPEAVLKNCRKIGEGVYGEVYLWRARDGRARVMKIVPIAGTTKVNGERQKDFQEIISEIVIAMELSALRAPIEEIQRNLDEGKSIDALDLHSVENATDVFNEVLAVRCVYGSYPSRLLDLWELYDECKGSDNDNPAILPVDQQYIVLELANAGSDLESYEFNSAEQAHALFLQVAFGLAVGEEAYQFEHRDLHWGNVLIAPTDQKFATFVIRGRVHRVPRCGVAATIIDYSLSRLSLPLGGDSAALYNDLAADDSLFEAVGDYQFHVYRLMRDKLGNDWKNFEPYTNILWLHYTVDKMITALRYKRTNTKIHKHYIAKLKGIKNRLLEYGSAAQFVLTDNEF